MDTNGVARLAGLVCVVALLLALGCTSSESEPAAAAAPTGPTAPGTTSVDLLPDATVATAVPKGPATPGTTLELLPDGLTRLVNEEVGYSFDYPSHWRERDTIEPTPLASGSGSRCDAVGGSPQFRPGSEPSGVAFDLYSFVQVCFSPLLSGAILDQFIQQAYGELDDAAIVDVNGTTAYRFANPLERRDSHMLQFLQTEDYRLEILAESTFGGGIVEAVDSFQLLEVSP